VKRIPRGLIVGVAVAALCALWEPHVQRPAWFVHRYAPSFEIAWRRLPAPVARLYAAVSLLSKCGDPSGSPGPTCGGSGVGTSTATLLTAVNGTNSATCPTDSQGNSWTNAVNITGGGFAGTYSLCYVNNPSTSATHTFTCGGTLCGVTVNAYSGTNTATPTDGTCSGNAGGSATQCSSALATTANGDLIVSGTGGPIGSPPPTVDSSLTRQNFVQGTGGVSYGATIADFVQPSSGSINPGWSDGASGTGVNVTAAFKAAAGGGATSHPCASLRLMGVGCEEHP
jgi:hypothetical protein